MAKHLIISTLVLSALLPFLQNTHCRVIIGDHGNEEKIALYQEGGSTIRSRKHGDEFRKPSDSGVQSQTGGDNNEKQQIKQQNHSPQDEKQSDMRPEEDPSMRSRRNERTDVDPQIEEGADVETISPVDKKKLSNIGFGFDSKDFVDVPLFFKFGAEATQGPFEQWVPSSRDWMPQTWNAQGQWTQWAFPGQGNSNPEKENRELE